MKPQQPRPGFELGWSIPFPISITITLRMPLYVVIEKNYFQNHKKGKSNIQIKIMYPIKILHLKKLINS